jgi:AhpD family alkylhydroperoxidase
MSDAGHDVCIFTTSGDCASTAGNSTAENPSTRNRRPGATRLRAVMAPGALDPLTKELIYMAVSATNGCSYCVHSHTAAARAKGLTPEGHAEFLAVLAMAAQTNALATALQVPVDPAFEA